LLDYPIVGFPKSNIFDRISETPNIRSLKISGGPVSAGLPLTDLEEYAILQYRNIVF